MYYVYVLKCPITNKLYYGYTKDLKRRLLEHNRKKAWSLVYYEAYNKETDARRREKSIKNSGQAIKALKTRIKDSLR